MKFAIDKELKLFVEDRTELEGLEKALKDSEATKKRHGKGLHQLARNAISSTRATESDHFTASIAGNVFKTTLQDVDEDPEFGALLNRVRSHIESMQNNTSSIVDISTAMTDSRAALDNLTWRSLDKGSYARLHDLDMT